MSNILEILGISKAVDSGNADLDHHLQGAHSFGPTVLAAHERPTPSPFNIKPNPHNSIGVNQTGVPVNTGALPNDPAPYKATWGTDSHVHPSLNPAILEAKANTRLQAHKQAEIPQGSPPRRVSMVGSNLINKEPEHLRVLNQPKYTSPTGNFESNKHKTGNRMDFYAGNRDEQHFPVGYQKRLNPEQFYQTYGDPEAKRNISTLNNRTTNAADTANATSLAPNMKAQQYTKFITNKPTSVNNPKKTQEYLENLDNFLQTESKRGNLNKDTYRFPAQTPYGFPTPGNSGAARPQNSPITPGATNIANFIRDQRDQHFAPLKPNTRQGLALNRPREGELADERTNYEDPHHSWIGAINNNDRARYNTSANDPNNTQIPFTNSSQPPDLGVDAFPGNLNTWDVNPKQRGANPPVYDPPISPTKFFQPKGTPLYRSITILDSFNLRHIPNHLQALYKYASR